MEKSKIRKIIFFVILGVVIIFLLFLALSYFIFGTPYSTEYNCSKVKEGDSLFSVLWKMGVPSYRLTEADGVKILGYPIPIASYADTPKNEIKFVNNKVVSKVCALP